jgi:hypothetical protein
VISDGCTKIDAPMIVPTTIAVAWGNRRERTSDGPVGVSRAGMR